MRRSRVTSFACALALALAAASPAGGWARDPVNVFYDRADCEQPRIDVEVWKRKTSTWVKHPVHPSVRVPSCQIEEAGWLFNELRWRCHPRGAWRIFRLFDPEVMARCEVGGVDSDTGGTTIVVTSPADGVAVQAPEPVVTVTGHVRVGGVAGADYDVVLVVDRSAPAAALDAQKAAARDFLARIAPRLGPVRVTLLSVAATGEDSSHVRRELRASRDAAALDAAVARIASQPGESWTNAAAALTKALDELAAGRAGARRVVLLGLDGAGLGADVPLAPVDPLRSALSQARLVALHWRAIGGAASEAPSWLASAVAERGSFARVPLQRYGSGFWGDVVLPVAESVRVERNGADPIAADLDAQGWFRARVPVLPGSNPLVIRARTSDGTTAERAFDLVFDDAQALERALEAERARIRAAQRKRLELTTEGEDEP